MKYKPHNYQAYASEFILDHDICLASCWIWDLERQSSPYRLCGNWLWTDLTSTHGNCSQACGGGYMAEGTEKMGAFEKLSCSLVLGSRKERENALSKRAFLYIINRENVSWLVENYRWDFDMVVIDELSSFKSNKAERFKAMKRVRPQVSRIVGLDWHPCSQLAVGFMVADISDGYGQTAGEIYRRFRIDSSC